MVDTRAIAHFKRTGLILPGAQGEVAAWLAERNEDRLHREENARANRSGETTNVYE